MARLKRRWLILDWLNGDCLRAQDIPYDDGQSVKTRIDFVEASKISEVQHEVLDTLAHNLTESCYREYQRTGNRVTLITTWTDSNKTEKIREEAFTYSSGRVVKIVERQYAAGVLKVTKTTDINLTAGQVASEDISVVYE